MNLYMAPSRRDADQVAQQRLVGRAGARRRFTKLYDNILSSNYMATAPNAIDRRGSTDSLPGVLGFMQLLWAVVHGLEKTSKRMSYDLGVTGPQRLALRVIGLFPGVSAGNLAETLHVHPSTLTGVLQRLVVERWLRRVDDPRDRRRAILRLTARGARINAARRGTVESAVADVLSGVSAQDREATMRVLERLARQLGSPAAKGASRKFSSRPNQSSGKKGG